MFGTRRRVHGATLINHKGYLKHTIFYSRPKQKRKLLTFVTCCLPCLICVFWSMFSDCTALRRLFTSDHNCSSCGNVTNLSIECSIWSSNGIPQPAQGRCNRTVELKSLKTVHYIPKFHKMLSINMLYDVLFGEKVLPLTFRLMLYM